MTKSGVGTHQLTQQSPNTTNSNQTTLQQNSQQISNAEIPIWISDKKKWVTGISKKTTINDLIYAILKQCQLVQQPCEQPIEMVSNQYVLIEYKFNNTDEISKLTNSIIDQQSLMLSSQRILNGESKVYKYLNGWSLNSSNSSANLMLKIFKKEQITASSNSNENSENTNGNENANGHSLASKLLKKFGVSTTSQPNLNQQNVSHSNMTSQIKYVDVKLPNSTNSTQSTSSSSRSQTNLNNKSQLCSSIYDKESKLKQQIEKFQLLDELIKETEKSMNQNQSILDQLASLTLLGQREEINSDNNNIQYHIQPNQIDLNDIYCHFPEMSTHNLKEVEDFQQMCSQLFKLDESIKQQKQVLSSLEYELQRELTNSKNGTSLLNNQNLNQMILNMNETPETVELRKEVNMSREQTRLQCKQLHDLDLKMRQNEQSLMVKEQQLQQLLEELYIQEIYSDQNINFSTNTNNNNIDTIKINDHLNFNQQKSLSIGNLNQMNDGDNLNKLMKNSPSLEINQNIAISSSSSSSSPNANLISNSKALLQKPELHANLNGKNGNGNSNADNDSGISSMSSETTNNNANTVGNPSPPLPSSSTTSTSSTNSSSMMHHQTQQKYFNYNTTGQFSVQQQHQHQQQQQPRLLYQHSNPVIPIIHQYQSNANNANNCNKANKPVLETLV